MVLAIVTMIALGVAGVVTMLPQQASAACFSGQSPSTGGHNTAPNTFTACLSPNAPGTQGATLQALKDQAAGSVKVSGSQTGFGQFPGYIANPGNPSPYPTV